MDYTKRRKLSNAEQYEDLLVPVFRNGEQVYTLPSIENIKERVKQQLNMFHEGIKRFVNPHTYPVGLEKGLYDFKTNLILQLRNLKSEAEEV
jgi:nicotinate phosphoribosyltransferase